MWLVGLILKGVKDVNSWHIDCFGMFLGFCLAML